jgi:hypothetical protein
MTNPTMSPYETRRWRELEAHWAKKAQRRQLLPPKVRASISAAGEKTKDVAVPRGAAIAEATPESIKEFSSRAADVALAPAVDGRWDTKQGDRNRDDSQADGGGLHAPEDPDA